MLVQRDIKVIRPHGANVVEVSRGIPGDEWSIRKYEAAVIEPCVRTVWSTLARIAREVGPLIEVRGSGAHRRRGNRHARTQIANDIECPSAQEGIANTIQIHRHAFAERQ